MARNLITLQGMSPAEQRLLRHLVIAVILKLVVLTLLWWLFIREARVSVDADQLADRWSGMGTSQGASK